MYDDRFLHMVYQQWMQGNDEYMYTWRQFVELAARLNHTTFEKMFEELQKYSWFVWKRD
jgi:hypothetical protein